MTPELIRDRLKNFWGYGNLQAPVWFVGMEEGLAGSDIEELQKRFESARGKATIDLRRDMAHLKEQMRWFVPGAPIQQTWRNPIRLVLNLESGRIPTKEEVRDYQARVLGNSVLKQSVNVELMPLPSNRAHESTWLYSEYGVEGCETRATYIEMYLPGRVARLKEMMSEHKPKLVIFYSGSYMPYWTEIIGEPPKEIMPHLFFVRKGDTKYCVIPQRARKPGLTNQMVDEFADKIRGL